MPRRDLLEYLDRYRDTPRRRLWRVERWRRRGRRRGEIAAMADALAAGLHERGVGAGDRVGIHVRDGPLWAAALFGVLRAGGIAVPIDVAHPADLVERIASTLELSAWIGDAELAPIDLGVPSLEVDWLPAGATTPLPPLPRDDPGRVAELVLTSGTTGLPKSVEVRHENLRAVLDTLEAEIASYRWLMRISPRLRLAVALPLSHLYGQFMGVLLPVALGADVALIDTLPAAELADAVHRERAWALAAVPHTLATLQGHLLATGRERWGAAGLDRRLQAAEGMPWPRRWRLFDALRRQLGRRLVGIVSGGASLDPEVERVWKLLGYVVVQGYGLTEAAPLVTLNHPFHPQQGTVGQPLAGVEVRLTNQGEILVRGANVATPSAGGPRLDDDGWLHTGDLGEELDDGSIAFRGRASNRIVTPAGVNVDPDETARALRGHAQVIDAVVLERPWGAPGVLCAVCVVYPGTDLAAAVRATNERLADAGRIRAWFVWPHGDLPRTPTGKARRAELNAWLEAQAPQAAAHPPSRGPAPSSGVDAVLAALAAFREDNAGDPGSIYESRLGEVLSSLDRVELAARLEKLYGSGADDALFSEERTVGELAATLRHEGTSAGTRDTPPGKPAATSTRHESSRHGGARQAGAEPDAARWRSTPAARAARFVLRECVIHPWARLLARFTFEANPAFEALREPCLLAANHTSPMDPVVQFALSPRRRAKLAPAARWNFFAEHPRGRRLYFWSVLGLNLFPLVQSGDWRPTLRIAGELVDGGHSILIYPEGEISVDGEIRRFQPGVAVMSRDLHLPIVPCATAGLERIVPPDARWTERESWKRQPVGICIGEPMPAVRPGDDLGKTVAELERRVRKLQERARQLAS